MLTKQYDVTAWLDKVGALGTFDTFTGGGVDSDELKYRLGGMRSVVTLGGLTEVDNVVIGRIYLLERDHVVVGPLLDAARQGRDDHLQAAARRRRQRLGPAADLHRHLQAHHPPTTTRTPAPTPRVIELEMTPSYVGLG